MFAPVFGLDPYHILFAVVGASIIASYWAPRFISGREPAASALLILTGYLAFAWIPGMPQAIDPTRAPRAWEVVSELCVIIGLFGAGLRIDRIANLAQWGPTLRLLLLAMPLTIALVAVCGWALAGMTLAGGILLGAILAPTDPVLAGDVQVGPPLEGGEHPVRYTLTTEAGLNDGLAFPFVHLGVAIAGAGALTSSVALHWIAVDVVYRIAAGLAAGVVLGWLLGKALFAWPRKNALAKTQSGVIALAGVLLVYGLAELVEGYGFIAAFVSALTLRRVESRHEYHRRLHDFTESLEHALTAILLVAVGAAIPVLWPYLSWKNAAVAAALIFAIRPLAAWMTLQGVRMRPRERAVVAFFGVRGIGSIYYLAYAGHQIELVNDAELWATVTFAILLSTVVHGLTAGVAVERVTGERQSGSTPPPRGAGT